jgi:choline dehydrogenase-like flavoprotein
MARGGQSVCLLELGKERWPGEFPTSIAETARELHVSGELAPNDTKGASTVGGDPTGLYHLVMGHGQNAFVGNGLGGTSLLNANVFLEADPGVLDLKMWPAELRGQDKWAKCKWCPLQSLADQTSSPKVAPYYSQF